MNILKKSIILGGCVAALTLGVNNHLMAQGQGGGQGGGGQGGGGGRRGGGNFDPAQMRQNRLDRLKDQLEVTDDTEWNAISPIAGKVIDAQMSVMSMRMNGMMGGGRRNRNNNNGGGNTDTTAAAPRRANPFGEPSAAMAALQKAIDDKAPAAELKTKLAAVRDEVKTKEAALTAAQEELKGVLTARQEAIAVVNGILQ